MPTKKKVLIIFGTRPEAIKMVPVIKELGKSPKLFQVGVCVTAQHREMLDQVLRIFNVKPDFDLDLMSQNQDLFDVTSRVLLGMRGILESYRPDMVLVHGDTTTSMAAALSAFYMHIPVGHVEAGLRTYDLSKPWPEEMNRQVTDTICDYFFAPTENSKKNLLQEGINDERIFVTGNTVIDSLIMAADMFEKDVNLGKKVQDSILKSGYNVSNSIKSRRKFILITGHRRENFGEGFENICSALNQIAERHPEIDLIYPVHLNPNVREPVFRLLTGRPNIVLIPPIEYLPFVYLMKHCHMILTDSGGIQEEAPSLGKPVLVMRDSTERPEAVASGAAALVGTSTESILNKTEDLLNNSESYNLMAKTKNPYGDGTAANKIALILSRVSI